jgi:molybdate transport system substrate-binding protein
MRRIPHAILIGPPLRFVLLGFFALAAAPSRAATNTVTLAAASDLVFCLEELNTRFREIHREAEFKVSTGSSGNFFAQIQQGAPFDVFLSADRRYPEELILAGAAVTNSLVHYANGQIVLWTTRSNLVVTNGLTILNGLGVRHVALASPEHAPYGRAARAALEKAGLWKSLQPKLVLGENIAQAAQYVQSGSAEVGLVALSLVSAPKLKAVGQWWLVPQENYPVLEQAAVLTRHGRTNALAQAYLEFLSSPAGREILDRHGFGRPGLPPP